MTHGRVVTVGAKITHVEPGHESTDARELLHGARIVSDGGCEVSIPSDAEAGYVYPSVAAAMGDLAAGDGT